MEDMIRYSVIREKCPREIVLLRGNGCRWRRCRFCDYHLDFSKDLAANYALNRRVLAQVTGKFGRLEVVNSGSFVDLDADTMAEIERLCVRKGIRTLQFECHWQDRHAIPAMRECFREKGIHVRTKLGVETFDALFRECYLDKGIDETAPEKLAMLYEECCLLAGLPGQTVESMQRDIEIGLHWFERVCVNVMTPNTARIQPDPQVVDWFHREVAPHYKHNERVDMLLTNTDFGVGGKKNGE